MLLHLAACRNSCLHLYSNRNFSKMQEIFSNFDKKQGRFKAVPVFIAFYLYARYRKVTIWPRVQGSLGAKVAAVLPVVMPFDTAQFTAFI